MKKALAVLALSFGSLVSQPAKADCGAFLTLRDVYLGYYLQYVDLYYENGCNWSGGNTFCNTVSSVGNHYAYLTNDMGNNYNICTGY